MSKLFSIKSEPRRHLNNHIAAFNLDSEAFMSARVSNKDVYVKEGPRYNEKIWRYVC